MLLGKTIVGPACQILVLITYTKVSGINSHAHISIKARDLSFHLHQNFVYAGSKSSEEIVHMQYAQTFLRFRCSPMRLLFEISCPGPFIYQCTDS